MRSFTRIGLPVLLVVGIVFGITFISMYSSDDSTHDGGGISKGGSGSLVLPLKFSTLIVSPVPIPPSGEIKDVSPGMRHLYYREPTIEVGIPGHYEFWCQNRNSEPVSVRVPRTNCQCAGVDLAVVAPETYKDYAAFSALANGPLSAASGPASSIVHALLNAKLTWKPLNTGSEISEQTIPGADPAHGPQFALVRLGWTGKESGPKSITADLYSNLPNGIPDHTALQVNTLVVPAYDILRRESPKDWVSTHELPIGELRENSVVKQEFFMASSTRTHFLYQIKTAKPDPCVTWSEVVPASKEEVASFDEFSRSKENSVTRLKSLYKAVVTVRERTEVVVGGKKQLHQLDLGVLEHKLTVEGLDSGSVRLSLKGRVLGDVTILAGAETGKIDLGNSIPSDQDKSRDVILSADYAGLDLTLVEKEISPNYLKVKLEPLQMIDGRKQWRLRVTIPKGNLFGSLPESSRVVLQTNSPTARRLTIPIKGMAFAASGPQL